MDRAALAAKLSITGLDQVVHALDLVARDAVRLLPGSVDGAQIAVGASKLGGAPDLAAGTPWPIWRDLPMSFLAQIRLEDVVVYDHMHLLPPAGLLLFFYDARQQTYGAEPGDRGGWQVLFAASTATLEPATFPAALPDNARFTACPLTFSPVTTLPPAATLARLGVALSTVERDRYEQLLADLVHDDSATVRHQLLGHPDQIQDDMPLQAALVSHGVIDDRTPRGATIAKTAQRWQLLLQLDSDDRTGMHWGSAGLLFYWIEQRALHAQHFNTGWLILQSD